MSGFLHRRSRCRTRYWLAVLASLVLLTTPAWSSTLDVPSPHTTLSGIGVIHGWKCQAGDLTVRFNGRAPLPLLYGAQRKDVQNADRCRHANVGFVSIMNWSELGDGSHTAVVYDDGVEFARSTFRVVTPGPTSYGGNPAYYTGTSGECLVNDWPDFNKQASFVWNVTTQHMELRKVYGADDPDPTGTTTDLSPFEFLVEEDWRVSQDWTGPTKRTAVQGWWTIEVPGVNVWKHVSASLDPTIQGDQVVPAPARIQLVRYPQGRPGYKAPWEPRWPNTPVEGAEIVGAIHGSTVRGGQAYAPGHGLVKLVALGGVLDMLPGRTALDLGVLDDRYALVIQVQWMHPRIPGMTHHRCFVLTFNSVQRTEDGGLDTLAYLSITEKEPDGTQYKDGVRQIKPGRCVSPVSPLYSTRLKIY